ncbi:DUF397 domain-containing protein [Actinomadura hibisca]|uniref:DUF397 domain-containing protein n=1 Tax=Actinomadura hibisca TaxID=68565 RepID=UPI00082EB1ED|nr:DUF397 domain-containing protein [Actinomadura hibisca]
MDLSKAVWRKSKRSHQEGDACVELATMPSSVAVRDSKDPEGSNILVDRQDFRRFVDVMKGL